MVVDLCGGVWWVYFSFMVWLFCVVLWFLGFDLGCLVCLGLLDRWLSLVTLVLKGGFWSDLG